MVKTKNTERYNRQIRLHEIGAEGQARLFAARVLVVGAGGLGCPVLQYLAAAGIGTIGIIDCDHVDISNLQRQILFCSKDVGTSKALTARERLLALNPAISIHAHNAELNDVNAPGLFSEYDIIVDGTDNFQTKFLINDVAIKLKKAVVYGAIQGFEGQVSVFGSMGGPCYRCLYPQPPQSVIMNCAEAGVMGALAGIIGTIQAMEVIKLIVRHDSFSSLSGVLWMIDTKTMQTRILDIPKKADCLVCSRPASEIIPQYASPVCSVNLISDVECRDLPTMPGAIMIDVREQDEWNQGHMNQALHIPLSSLKANPEIFSPHRENTCILYCQRGMRSRAAAEILLNAGFTKIFSLKGGYEMWLDANP